jgi:nucleotide-binding universal stress UspA family protein
MAARAATAWAATEAGDRGVPLRLVSVIDDETHRSQAEDALRLARGAVENQAVTVQVEEVIRHGSSLDVLLQESAGAAMVCVGSSHRCGTALDVTSTTLAQQAQCNVAIIRSEGNGESRPGGIITVVLDDLPGNDAIVHQAMREGRLRHATVRQVDRRLKSWVRRFPDVHVEVVAAGTGRSACQSSDHNLAELAVIGHADAQRLTGLVSPNCHAILGYPDVSMLFVHDDSDEDCSAPESCDGHEHHELCRCPTNERTDQ